MSTSNSHSAGASSPPEQSGIHPSLLPRVPLSVALWGVSLGERLPLQLSKDGVRAVPGELTRIGEFLAREFPALVQESLGVVPGARIASAKRRYLSALSDFIELRDGEHTVGVFVGAPEDWGSYYCRSFAVLPSYQRPGLIRRFVKEALFEPLAAAGVERFIAETAPTNLAMSRLFTELHFHATGHNLSDRWGALVRYTKFLDPASELAFMKRFGGVAAPGD